MSLAWSAAATALGLGGVGLLYRAWRDGGGAAPVGLGWLLLAASSFVWRLSGPSWDKAVALATLSPMLIAAAFLAPQLRHALRQASAKHRRPKAPRMATGDELGVATTPLRRSVVRGVLVGPVAGAAATGWAAAIALKAPCAQADRFVAAVFALPLVWAGAGVWAITDNRVGRVGAALGVLALAGFAAAVA